jgi:hypothetical protein
MSDVGSGFPTIKVAFNVIARRDVFVTPISYFPRRLVQPGLHAFRMVGGVVWWFVIDVWGQDIVPKRR